MLRRRSGWPGCARYSFPVNTSGRPGRDPERLQLKYSKMRSNAFVFMRATCHLFYDRLPQDDLFKRAPLTWACGDLHLENFGSYKGDNRLVYFDLNDFDEAALAPACQDGFFRGARRGAPHCRNGQSRGRSLCNFGAGQGLTLIDFGNDKTWREKLLSTSQDCAGQVQADAEKFNAAYDDAVFAV